MATSNRYVVNSNNIIHETIDNEVVIVDLDKGFYYSLRDTAAQIWISIIAGASEEDILRIFSEQYNIDRLQIEKQIRDFIHQLKAENIISQTSTGANEDLSDGNNPQLIPHPDQAEFKAPIMEKFTDMSELLLLDPIHEVDETGWPNMAPDQTADEQN